MPAFPARPPALATWHPAAGQVYDCLGEFLPQNVLEPKLKHSFPYCLNRYSIKICPLFIVQQSLAVHFGLCTDPQPFKLGVITRMLFRVTGD